VTSGGEFKVVTGEHRRCDGGVKVTFKVRGWPRSSF